jgi:hypothetical protein
LSVAQRLLSAFMTKLFGSQFTAHRSENLFDGFSVSFGSCAYFIPGQTLMPKLGLQISDRCLRIRQQSFSTFFGRRQRTNALPSGIERISFGIRLMLAAMHDLNLYLAIAHELAPAMEMIGWLRC